MHNIQPSIDYSGKRWFMNGKLHRKDGPAVEWAGGTKQWYLNGILHRTDGPATQWHHGAIEWYLHGNWLPFDEWCKQTTGLTDKQKTLYRLQYA